MKTIKFKQLFRVIILQYALLWTTSGLFAQKNSIKIGMNYYDVNLVYERNIIRNISFLAGFSRFTTRMADLNENVFNSRPVYKDSGKGSFLEVKVHLIPGKSPLTSLYMSLNLSFQNHELTYRERIGYIPAGDSFLSSQRPIYQTTKVNVRTFGRGTKLGYQKIFKNRLLVDFGLNFFKNKIKGDDQNPVVINGYPQYYRKEIQGFKVMPYLGMGFAF